MKAIILFIVASILLIVPWLLPDILENRRLRRRKLSEGSTIDPKMHRDDKAKPLTSQPLKADSQPARQNPPATSANPNQ